MIRQLNLPTYSLRLKKQAGKTFIFDEVRKKFLVLTPEEWVRQNFICFLIRERKFPSSLMVVEGGLRLNANQFRTDLLVYDRKGQPLLIAEFKAPEVKITQAAFDQIARYNSHFGVPYLIVSNGMTHFCCQMDLTSGNYQFLKAIPVYDQLC